MDIWLFAVAFGLILGLVVILALVRRRAAPVRTCLRCGRNLPPDAAYCSHCLDRPQAQNTGLPDKCLVVASGALAGQSFVLQPPPRGLVIGRSPECDIVTDEIMVSRLHAQVMAEDDQVVLYDRDSTNGTWLIDGRRVSRHVLALGDRFQIGSSVFVYALQGRPLPAPPLPLVPRPAADLQAHSYFEGYTLLDLLGRGGMSAVYRAQSPDGTDVALKVLDAVDEWVARKFIQEGNIGTALRDSPYIRVVYDLRYSQDGRPYLIMEYVDGISLRKLMGMPMPPAQVVGVIGQVCEALDFAHQRQIVHRDIKPENILLARGDVVKVTDFGIAKLTSAVTVTSDRIVGTPEYISPEQAKGEPVGPASDIYSLGVVLYELLTGQVPFPLPSVSNQQDARSAAYTVIRQHVYETPTPPGQLNPAVASTPLERAAVKALEKDPSKRYKGCLAMARALGYETGRLSGDVTLPATMAHLTLLDGPNQGHVIVLERSSVTLGRELLEPDNVQISRQHAVLVPRGQSVWLQDISKNGTWVNGQRVYGEAPLTGGDIIEIAGRTMRLDIQAADERQQTTCGPHRGQV